MERLKLTYKPRRKRKKRFVLACLVGAICLLSWQQLRTVPYTISPKRLAQPISKALDKTGRYPSSISVPVYEDSSKDGPLQILLLDHTIDNNYSELLQKFFARYQPDYASAAIINPDTGAILAMESFIKNPQEKAGHLATKADFPAASVFKIVTAAAAIDKGQATADTMMAFNGRAHTLYRKNVKDNDVNRWTRHVTLKEAFGKSINSVFGKLGLFHVGSENLSDYAEAFYFNKKIPADLNIEKSKFLIDPTDTWELVESAAGFTNRTTLSPLHGALISASILNNGVMPKPFSVVRASTTDGVSLYEAKPEFLGQIMSKNSAQQMQELMHETVIRGTSRKAFRGLSNHRQDMVIGGKTGSLDGETLQGRTDWFVGYASHEDVRLAVGIVTVHKKYWTIKSSMLARLFFEDVFRQKERERQALAKNK